MTVSDISGFSKYNDSTGFTLSDFGGGGGGGGRSSSKKPDWARAAELAGKFLSSAAGGGRDKYRTQAEQDSYKGPRILDRGRGGFGGELMEGFAIYDPQRDPVIYNPMGGGASPTTSTGQRLARAGGGALSGAATGAALGSAVPGIGTAIGAVGGAIIGGLGSLFG
jgi:hypothetical protein